MAVWNRETRSKKNSKEDAWRQIHRISQSEAFPEDRSIGPANQKRFQKIRPDSFSSNQISLAGHTSQTHRHTDHIPLLSNQISLGRTFGWSSDGPSSSRPIISFGRTFRRSSDGPSSSRPIISFGWTFGRYSDRPSSSYQIIFFGQNFGRSSDGLSLTRPIIFFGRTIGRSSDGPSSSRPITSFGQTFVWTSDGPSSCSPITSFGASSEKLSRDSSHLNCHGPHEWQDPEAPDLVQHVIRTILDRTKETVGNGGRSRHTQNPYNQYPLSRFTRKSCTSFAQVALSA